MSPSRFNRYRSKDEILSAVKHETGRDIETIRAEKDLAQEVLCRPALNFAIVPGRHFCYSSALQISLSGVSEPHDGWTAWALQSAREMRGY